MIRKIAVKINRPKIEKVLTKRNRDKTQINKIRNLREGITAVLTEIKNMIRDTRNNYMLTNLIT